MLDIFSLYSEKTSIQTLDFVLACGIMNTWEWLGVKVHLKRDGQQYSILPNSIEDEKRILEMIHENCN